MTFIKKKRKERKTTGAKRSKKMARSDMMIYTPGGVDVVGAVTKSRTDRLVVPMIPWMGPAPSVDWNRWNNN